MTKAEREMVLYLIYDGGADCCQKCIHLNKPSCGRYVSPTDYSKDCSDDYCIDGMAKFFEKHSLTMNYAEIVKTDRLTQWTEKGASLILGEPKSQAEATEVLKKQFKTACNRLAEFEDKLESGQLKVLPCSVGDTVYTPYCGAYSWIVFRIDIYKERTLVRLGNSGTEDYCNVDLDSLGKDWFLTKEEAEHEYENRLKALEQKQ